MNGVFLVLCGLRIDWLQRSKATYVTLARNMPKREADLPLFLQELYKVAGIAVSAELVNGEQEETKRKGNQDQNV